MRIDWDQEIEETQRKKKPKKTRQWHLSGRNKEYRYFKVQINQYENTIELTKEQRYHAEQGMYRFKETHQLTPELMDAIGGTYNMLLAEDAEELMALDEAASLEEDAYREALHKATNKLTTIQKQIFNLYMEGQDLGTIAKTLDRDYTDVWHQFYGQHRVYKGEKKLYGGIIQALKAAIERETLKKKIIEMTAGGYSSRKIAKRLGVTQTLVLKMLKEND